MPALISALLACALLAAACVILFQRQRHAIDPARLAFTQLTFGRGVVAPACFSPDGKTVFYSAAWEGRSWEVFETRPGFSTSRPLGLTEALLLSVSSAGMLAVKPEALSIWNFGSGLAQVPITGGTPRLVYDNVAWAGWNPDGRTLAIVRSVGGKDRLEMPPGRVLYETGATRDVPSLTEVHGSLIENPRCSPDGRRVAFTEYPYGGMQVTRVVVVDTTGRVEARTAEGTFGAAWSADGREVWFTTMKDQSMTELRALALNGLERLIARLPGMMVLWDVGRDGRALMTQAGGYEGIRGRGAPPARERELGWFDRSAAAGISTDGKTLLFDGQEIGGAGGVFVRGMDGSPAVRLGAGRALGLSPDGKWALTLQTQRSPQLVLLPTGAGDSLAVPRGNIAKYFGARWMPDGARILFTGSEPGRTWRSYVQDISGGPPRPVTREGVIASLVSPDGKRVVYVARDKYFVMPLGADSGRVVADRLPGETLIQWASQGEWLYAMQADSASSIRMSRLDLVTGRRVPWRTLSIADPAGFAPFGAVITPDGQAYAVSYGRLLSNLFLVEGLK